MQPSSHPPPSKRSSSIIYGGGDLKPSYQSFGLNDSDAASRRSTRDYSTSCSTGTHSVVSTPRTVTPRITLEQKELHPSAPLLNPSKPPPSSVKASISEAYDAIFSKSSLVSGLGFFSDAYDLFVIDLVLAVLRGLCVAEGHPYGATEAGLIASATLFGAVAGQIGFGAVSDIVGRKVLFVVTGSLVVVGSLASAMVVWTVSSTFNIFKQLALCRFVLGLGIGGEYPLAATVTSENCKSDRHRGKAVAAIFSMQGFGMLFSPICMLACLNLFSFSLEATWRICLALGALPSAIAVFYRFSLSESKVFEAEKEAATKMKSQARCYASPVPAHAAHVPPDNFVNSKNRNSMSIEMIPNIKQQPTDGKPQSHKPSTVGSRSTSVMPITPRYYPSTWSILRSYCSTLIGTCMTWFLLDVTLYGTGTFKSVVNESIVGADDAHVHAHDDHEMSTIAVVRSDSRFALIIALVALPGYFLSVCFVDIIGRRRLQLGGFAMMTFLFAFLAVSLAVQESAFGIWVSVVAFGLTFLFSNFGPNVTTFILPTEVYPTRVRATCHGLSAAAGKLGGAVGALVFSPLHNAFGVSAVMGCCSAIALLGALFTYWYTEDATGVDLRSMDSGYTQMLSTKAQRNSSCTAAP